MLNLKQNIALATDSYKVSHWSQFPQGLEYSQYYVESRGGEFDSVMISGVRYLAEVLSQPLTVNDVEEAAELYKVHFGDSSTFNYDGFMTIAKELNGRLPVEIRAIGEGTVVPNKTPVLVIENTDPRFGWLPGFLETFILRAIWYGSTVATVSFETKKILTRFMDKTVDDEIKDQLLPFKLHDFGARGVSSAESAMLGGIGHLFNFMGSDTVEAVYGMKKLYTSDVNGYSIPSREHSSTTIYGEDGEDEAFLNSIEQWGAGIYGVVMDSYDYEAALHRITTGELKEKIIASGGTFVARPDSGNPVDVVMTALEIIGKNVGYTVNSKGYKVLHPSYRVIQGDGVDIKEILRILTYMEGKGWSAENIAFGMGGGLLQKVDRDTNKWAMKMCASVINGEFREVFKAPKTDMSKASKRGYLDVTDSFEVISSSEFSNHDIDSILDTVYLNGEVDYHNLNTLDEIRDLSNRQARNLPSKLMQE